MRNWINLLESNRLEVAGVLVWQNPNKAQVTTMFRKSDDKKLRALLLDDLFVWDAAAMIHRQMQKQLENQGIDLDHAIYLMLYQDGVEIGVTGYTTDLDDAELDVASDDEADDDDEGCVDPAERYIGSLPMIQRLYGPTPSVWRKPWYSND